MQQFYNKRNFITALYAQYVSTVLQHIVVCWLVYFVLACLLWQTAVFVWSGCKCSWPGSVTALICSGGNRTEPDTGYSHSLNCSSVTSKVEMPHTYTYHSTSLHRTLELTVMSINCLLYGLFVCFIHSMVRTVRLQNKKCSESGPKWWCSGPEPVVPVPVLVTSKWL